MTLRSWLPTFLGFPAGGLIAIEVVGSVEGPLTAAGGGLIAGAAIGAAQWVALRRLGVGATWIAATVLGLAVGSALAAVVVGTGTDVTSLMLTGVVAGATVGAAQARLLPSGPRTAVVWPAATGAAWALGWLTTWSIGVDVERAYTVFGSSGAVAVTLLTGAALLRLLARTAAGPHARPAFSAVADSSA